jgi:uncharacterized protein YceK
MNQTRELVIAIAAAAVISGCGSAAAAQGSRAGAVGNDWYSASQAAQGKALFAQKMCGPLRSKTPRRSRADASWKSMPLKSLC